MTDQMAAAPPDALADVFTSSIDGVFGRFEAATSYKIFYILTALRLSDLERLEVAREAFPFEDVDFEELIQRDIDYSRVDDELVSYLEDRREGARFFPPLLISVVPVGEDGRILERYRSIQDQIDPGSPGEGRFVRTWDVDKFQLALHTRSVPTGHVFNVGQTSLNYIPHAARLRYNREGVKLVVIDGQHRFEALRSAHRRDRQTLGSTTIPVCVLFSANATADSSPTEDIRRDFRELFVTINSRAKEVSGHFLVLLADQSLSAKCVRALANKWKFASPPLLPLLEWNTREASKAHQLQRPFSITTVSILAEALAKYAFRSTATTEVVLGLRASDGASGAVQDGQSKGVNEDTFLPDQEVLLKGQIEKECRPALESLFLKPRPYAAARDVYLTAWAWLQKCVAERTPGAEQYLEVLLGAKRLRNNDLPAVRDVQASFEARFYVGDRRINDAKPYFFNVFQQGLIRAWTLVCTRVSDPSGAVVAEALVAGLAGLCFHETGEFFSSSHLYIQNALFRGERVIVSEVAKVQWSNLILATLLHRNAHEGVASAIAAAGKRRQRLEDRLRDLAQKSLVTYLGFLRGKTVEFVQRNWRYIDLDSVTVTYLLERADSEDETEQAEFSGKVEELANARYRRAQDVLLNRLGLRASDVKKWSTGDAEGEEQEL